MAEEHKARRVKLRIFRNCIRQAENFKRHTFTGYGDAFLLAEMLNTPIQGTAADILKLAMVRILSKLEEYPYIKPLLTIHDEILFEVPRDKTDEACTIIKECIETQPFPEFDVPLKAEGAKGVQFRQYGGTVTRKICCASYLFSRFGV